jgi:hypothetical protein
MAFERDESVVREKQSLVGDWVYEDIQHLAPYIDMCPIDRHRDEVQITIPIAAPALLCDVFLENFDLQMSEIRGSLAAFEAQIDTRSTYGREALDHITDSVNQLLDNSRSIMWRAVRGTVAWPETPTGASISCIEDAFAESKTCEHTALVASKLIGYISEVVKPLPAFEIEFDGVGNVIIDWALDSRSYEWTVTKTDDSWPMVRVYEYSRKISRNRQRPEVRTWHNAKSIGERFQAVVNEDRQG